MNKTRALVVSALLWEACFGLLCIAPLPVTWNRFDATRQLALLAVTGIVFAHGIAALVASRRGLHLNEVAIALLGTPLLYLIAAASQPELAWMPIVLAGWSLIFTASMAWRNI